MIRVLGSNKRFCDGLTRRNLLHIGALAPLGLSLAGWARAQPSGATPAASGSGKAKRCLLLYLWGSPSQLETFDPKPDAPLEVRGEFRSIPTALPGVRIGEDSAPNCSTSRSRYHPPLAHASVSDPRDRLRSDRCADDRSHPGIQPAQSAPVAVHRLRRRLSCRTGRPKAARRAPELWFAVSVGVETPGETRPVRRLPRGGLRHHLVGVPRAGTREVLRDAGAPDMPTRMIADPFVGILPTDRFESIASDETITLDRFQDRASLLDQLDAARRKLDAKAPEDSYDRHRLLARSVLTSGKLRAALDVQRKPAKRRERYGMALFGQSCLAARRCSKPVPSSSPFAGTSTVW